MHWEYMYGNRDQYEARLREIAEERLAHRVWMANHPLPKFISAMRTRLGQWLVAWGTALQREAAPSYGEGPALPPKWSAYTSAPDW